LKEHWNLYNKKKIYEGLKYQLRKELESKSFIDDRKFEIMNKEMGKVLKELGLEIDY
jgi:hypothetical protein